LNIFKFIQMMILGLVIIFMIIFIVFISNTEKDELETVIDLFDKSNEITVISSKLNEYIANNHYTKGKHFLMFSIIRSLTNKKKLELTIAMRQYFINNNLQITMEIIENEITNIDNNITTYRSNLNSKLSQILHLDNSIITVV
jgi:hypothetical protein